MRGRQYLDGSSMRVERIEDRLSVRFNISSSLKAVMSRVRTSPNSELKSATCVLVNNGKPEFVTLKVADLVAFHLPVGTVDILVGLSPKGSKGVGTLSAHINLPVKYLDIVGKQNEVVNLCKWLNVPITELLVE